MTQGGSKYFKIKIDAETGEVVKKGDEKGNAATEITPAALEQLYQNQAGVKHVGTILHAHSSPGCVYIIYRGKCFKVCS